MTEFILQGKTPSGMKRYWERQFSIQSTVQSPGYRPKANVSNHLMTLFLLQQL